MSFTGQLGTEDSMPGNIALGQSALMGGATGGPGPGGSASASTPKGRAHRPVPKGRAMTSTPKGS